MLGPVHTKPCLFSPAAGVKQTAEPGERDKLGQEAKDH